MLVKEEYHDEINSILMKYVSPLLLDGQASPFLV